MFKIRDIKHLQFYITTIFRIFKRIFFIIIFLNVENIVLNIYAELKKNISNRS